MQGITRHESTVAKKGRPDLGLPIVFIHYGGKEYLRYSLQQATRSNPTSTVYLLGDDSNRGHGRVSHHLIADLSAGATAFERSYRHLSTNSHRAELLCFQRWYVLLDFLKRSGISSCLYLDSDVLLYEDVTADRVAYAEYDLSLVRQFVPCTMYISGVEVLEEFCQFVTDIYTGRRQYEWDFFVASYALRRKNNMPGGASDMTAFHLFHQEHFGRVGELGLIVDDAAYDISISTADPGMEMIDGVKRLHWKDGRPFATHSRTGREIRMKTLHCQGWSKDRMRDLFTSGLETAPGAQT
jgi:hypothetical protein